MTPTPPVLPCAVLLAALAALPATSRGAVVYGATPSSAPPAATNAWPVGATARFGGFTLALVGPHHGLHPTHTGISVGTTVALVDGTTRRVASIEAVGVQDLALVKLDGADVPRFASLAPAGTSASAAVFVGNGSVAGAAVPGSNGAARGWFWNLPTAGTQRHASVTTTAVGYGSTFEVPFTATSGSFAATSNDSGGGLFQRDAAGRWWLNSVTLAIYVYNADSINVDGRPASLLKSAGGGAWQSTEQARPAEAWLAARLPRAGDVRGNGGIAFDDLLALAQGYGRPGTWSTGDLTGDGLVNFSDLLVLAQKYSSPAGGGLVASSLSGDSSDAPQPVPEPSLAGLAAGVGILVALGRRRRTSAAA